MLVKFQGHIDNFILPSKIIGWALNTSDPDGKKPTVIVSLQGRSIGSTVSQIFREDLRKFGSGEYSFEVECAEKIQPASILSGDIKVELMVDNENIGRLSFGRNVKNICMVLEVARMLETLHGFGERAVDMAFHHALPHVGGPTANVIRSSFTLFRNGGNRIQSFTPYQKEMISSLPFKAGIVSHDRAAMLGQEGHLFLVAGSNNVAELYETPFNSDLALNCAGKWFNLVETRLEFCASQKAEFLQVVIPEKLSVARELFDGRMSMPTANLFAFEQKIRESLDEKHYLSGLSCLTKMPFGSAFRKIDSHFTPHAAFQLFREICSKLNFDVTDNTPFDIPVIVTGDLGERFFGYELYDVCMTAREPVFRAGLKLVSSTNPRGAYVGKKYVFQNDLAPIRKKVILFGNSFCDNPVFQGSVSYWMSLWFSEYHFVFLPEMDKEYITQEQPDMVICQTIERFMEMLPDS
jgi:hypothetical protein